MKNLTFIQWTTVVIILFCILLIIGVVKTDAFYVDDNLRAVWHRRADLQKAFPDYASQDLVDWAKKYGWKEDPTLIKFSPSYKAIEVLPDVEEKDYTGMIESQGKIISNLIQRVEIQEEKSRLLENGKSDKDDYSQNEITVNGEANFRGDVIIDNQVYIKLPVTSQTPLDRDCNEILHRGRVVILDIKDSSAKPKLYICQQVSSNEFRWQW